MRCITVFAVVLSATVTYGDDALCRDQLVKNLPDSHLSSSDNRDTPGLHAGPERARLNTTETKAPNGTTLEGAWSPRADSQRAYIQSTFDDVTIIDSIMTQGRNQGNEFVKLYTVEYTEDGKTWKTLTSQSLGVEQIFQGNSDSDSIQENQLDCPIFAKGIRIIPKEWQGHVALRFDVKGCNLDDTASAVTVPSVATLGKTIPTTITTTTKKTTTTKTTTKKPMTTPYVFHPGIPTNLLPVTQKTTIPPPFMPGWFGTTKAAGPLPFAPSIIG